jgi:hypothetical protein
LVIPGVANGGEARSIAAADQGFAPEGQLKKNS